MTVSINQHKAQTVILIPVKAPNLAKSRMLKSINSLLTQKLVEAMLIDVLDVVSKIQSVQVVIVAPDHAYQKIINDYEIDLFIDSGSGYNECISEFISKNTLDNKTKLLIIPADQPRISIIEINKIIEMMNKKQVVQVIAEDGGTGALGLNPFDIMPTLFGEHSSQLHREYSKKNGFSFYEFENLSLSYDIDQFDDLELENKHPFGEKTKLIIDEIMDYNKD
tara:strand:+ start:393 stop:1058 length:666 start_codon:yes stop_codon:yes gene_type:complete